MTEGYVEVVRALIRDRNGRVLLLERAFDPRYDSGKLCLPGGVIIGSESSQIACAREIREETGLLIEEHYSDIPIILVDIREYGKFICYYYSLDRFSGKLRINKESSRAFWRDVDDLEENEIAFPSDWKYLQYFTGRNIPRLRRMHLQSFSRRNISRLRRMPVSTLANFASKVPI